MLQRTATEKSDHGDLECQELQRADGGGRLRVKAVDHGNAIAELFESGCAKLRFPRVAKGRPLETIAINTAGGLTGGDRMRWQFSVGEGAALSVTTQACERIYKARPETSVAIDISLDVASCGQLAWLPQETIVFDRSAVERHIDVTLAPGARLLMVEPLVFGRAAMGETVSQLRFVDRWRVRVGGTLVHAEESRFEDSIADQAPRKAVLADGGAMATVLLVAGDADTFLEPVRQIIGATAGASFWTVGGHGKLLARLVAESSYALRKDLVRLVALLNGQAGLPKIWST